MTDTETTQTGNTETVTAKTATTTNGETQVFLRTVLLPSIFLLIAMLNLTLPVAGLKELIVDELGGTAKDAGLFFSIEMLAYIICAPLWGLLSDRLNRRRIFVVIGFLVTAGFYAAYGQVQDLRSLLILRFFQGASAVMGWSTLMAMVLDQPNRKKQGRYMGLMGGALSLGVSIGAPLGGYLSKAQGTRAPLEVAAILFLIIGFGSLILREQEAKRKQIGVSKILSTIREQPRLLWPALFYFTDRYTVGTFIILFPLYLGTLGIDDPAVRGRYLAFFLLPFALLQYFSGRLAERIGPYKPLILGSFLYGILLTLVGYTNLYALWWVMIGLGVLAAVMFPPAILLTARWSDESTRGSAMGGFNLAGSLGFAVGPLVGVWAYEAYGYGFAFIVAGSLEILVAFIAFFWMRRWNLTTQPPTGELSSS